MDRECTEKGRYDHLEQINQPHLGSLYPHERLSPQISDRPTRASYKLTAQSYLEYDVKTGVCPCGSVGSNPS